MAMSGKFKAYDQAVANLKKAGLGPEFLNAVKNDPKLQGKISNITNLPKGGGIGPKAGWSCCASA